MSGGLRNMFSGMSDYFQLFSISDPAVNQGIVQASCQDFDKYSFNFCGKIITVNRLYYNQFNALSEAIKSMGYDDNIVRVDSFNCRKMRGFGAWSYHSFGQAIDLNPSEFRMVSLGDKYQIPMWYNLITITAKNLGFRWGGDFSSRFNPMHFEIGSKIRR